MSNLLEWIPLSRNEDIERLIKIVEKAIKEKEVTKTKQFTETKGKIKPLPEDEKEEAESFSELKKKIVSKRQEQGNDLIKKLAAKYGADMEEEVEPSEEAFDKTKKSLLSNKSKTIKKKKSKH